MKSQIKSTWIEMSQGFLYDGPPKRRVHEAILFTNHCELRQTPSGSRYVQRRLEVESVVGATREEMDRRLVEFMERAAVRMLSDGIEANNHQLLPARVNNPPYELVAGTAEIYADKGALLEGTAAEVLVTVPAGAGGDA